MAQRSGIMRRVQTPGVSGVAALALGAGLVMLLRVPPERNDPAVGRWLQQLLLQMRPERYDRRFLPDDVRVYLVRKPGDHGTGQDGGAGGMREGRETWEVIDPDYASFDERLQAAGLKNADLFEVRYTREVWCRGWLAPWYEERIDLLTYCGFAQGAPAAPLDGSVQERGVTAEEQAAMRAAFVEWYSRQPPQNADRRADVAALRAGIGRTTAVVWWGGVVDVVTIGGLILLVMSLGWVPERWRAARAEEARRRRTVALYQGRCPGCGYDIRVITGERCPECGANVADGASIRGTGERVLNAVRTEEPGDDSYDRG